MKLNTDRKFPANMVNAHTLLLKAKRGEKGNSKGKRYAVPAFNVTTFQGINAAIKACVLLGSSGLLAFSNSALKHIGDGDQTFALEVLSNYTEEKSKNLKTIPFKTIKFDGLMTFLEVVNDELELPTPIINN